MYPIRIIAFKLKYRLTKRNPLSKNPKAKKYLNDVTITSYERAFDKLLQTTCTPFYSQYPFRTKRSFIIADFYIPSAKLVFEIDGKYHENKIQAQKDKGKEFHLMLRGIKVIRIKNEDVKNWRVDRIEEIIQYYKRRKKCSKSQSKRPKLR